MKQSIGILFIFIIFCLICVTEEKSSSIVDVDDFKEWKKILRTRTNVLGVFVASQKTTKDIIPVFEKVATNIKGKGTIVFVDCKDSKKLCKTLKVKPKDYLLKHYQDGAFHKDYDRPMRELSLISFMNDPSADAPWSEDETASNVKHIENVPEFYKTVNKEKKPLLVMFYAPWCGHCKRMKPEFASAANRLKGQAILAGMNVDYPEAYKVRQEYNITGFPTVIYFEGGERLYDYWDERNEESIVNWMLNPQPPPEEPTSTIAEEKWSDEESDVVHLTTEMFDTYIASNPSVLVMFYAPWCGHCKAMKPHFTEAARIIKEEGIEGQLAAIDATAETKLGKQFSVTGYPTIKYFQNGELMYDYGFSRTTDAIVDFMKDPKAPPPPEKDWSEIPSEVTHLTDETFKDVLKKKKNALVFFYAPWCGHCKAAKPFFTSAAERIVDRKTAFAAIDCTKYAALCTNHDVQGYPTIKYFNYGKKEFKYMGPRTEDGFIEFMSNPTAFMPNTKEEL